MTGWFEKCRLNGYDTTKEKGLKYDVIGTVSRILKISDPISISKLPSVSNL